jgi:hypothetical protein
MLAKCSSPAKSNQNTKENHPLTRLQAHLMCSFVQLTCSALTNPKAVRDFTFIRTTKRHNGQTTVIPAAKVIKFCNLLFNCSIITIVQLAVAFAFHVLMDSIYTLKLFGTVITIETHEALCNL